MSENHFQGLAEELKTTPGPQRPERLIGGICEQMQQSNNSNTQQLGSELKQVQPQIVRALQQG